MQKLRRVKINLLFYRMKVIDLTPIIEVNGSMGTESETGESFLLGLPGTLPTHQRWGNGPQHLPQA